MKISVVIRTRDKEKHFDNLLENLAEQTIQVSEIVIVDNFSDEAKLFALENSLRETIRKCFGHGLVECRLIGLSDNEFSHAYSTNLGISATTEELVCITNAHSLPISRHWLQDGMKHFEDGKVAGVSGFFIPHQEKKAISRINDTLYYLSEKMVLRQDWCSTINCIIRKSLWKVYPFDENLPIIIPETRRYGLEDYDWSKEMTARGFKIIVDPSFSVFHSHVGAVSEITRNIKAYFVYRRIQQKINLFDRPRKSFSKVFQTHMSCKEMIV